MNSIFNPRIYISLMLLLIPATSRPEQILHEKVIGSYIKNFANHIVWPDAHYGVIKLVVISSDNAIINEFKQMAEVVKIKEKPISIEVLFEPDESMLDAQLIFISAERNTYQPDVFDKIEGKPILLISEEYRDKSLIMLNLFVTKDKTIRFEINKANILNQNLGIGEEILLMGGTEIDVAGIYMKSQKNLRKLEKEINGFESRIESLSVVFKESHENLAHIQQLSDQQSEYIEKQNKIHTAQLKFIQEQKQVIKNQTRQLEDQQLKIKQFSDSLKFYGTVLSEQQAEIDKRNKILETKAERIDSMNLVLAEINLFLGQKDSKISQQRIFMYLMGIIVIITLIFIGFIYKAYRTNRQKNEVLRIQQMQISTMNDELRTVNSKLIDNNQELTETLQKVKKMQQKLVHSEKMASLGVLSAGIAHEINNPINFVYAGINSLLRDFEDIEPIITAICALSPDNEHLSEKLQQIEILKEENAFNEAIEAIPMIINDIKLGADRTAEIIRGLRQFSRSEEEKPCYANIHEGIDIALLLLKNKYKNRIEIIKEYADTLPSIECFPGKLNQAFLNIIANAVDAIKDNGKIIIRTHAEDLKIIISIKDNGSGISEEIRQKIFDPFFTTKAVGAGTGLGLSITYGIIQEHKGSIELYSEIGAGTEFIITLPLTQS